MDRTTLPVIVGSRDFLPDQLATAATGPEAFSPSRGWPTPRSWRPLRAENTCGTVADRVPAGPMCCAGLTTDDLSGEVHACVSDAAFTDDPLIIIGGRAVVQVPDLRELMCHIRRNGFQHHVAMTAAHTAGILAEGFETCLGWEVYHHGWGTEGR